MSQEIHIYIICMRSLRDHYTIVSEAHCSAGSDLLNIIRDHNHLNKTEEDITELLTQFLEFRLHDKELIW